MLEPVQSTTAFPSNSLILRLKKNEENKQALLRSHQHRTTARTSSTATSTPSANMKSSQSESTTSRAKKTRTPQASWPPSRILRSSTSTKQRRKSSSQLISKSQSCLQDLLEMSWSKWTFSVEESSICGELMV